MYLLKLSANNPNFKEVKFFKNGVNIIKGVQISNDRKKTYNGVGKSLLIKLIDFCLGCSEVKDLKKLTNWEFFLEVEINGINYIFSRETNNQKIIKINSIEYDLNSFKTFLENKLFISSQLFDNFSYRTLITRFIRPTKESYTSYKKIFTKEKDYVADLSIAFLLGLDTTIMNQKIKLKTEIDEEASKKKFYENDERLKRFLISGKDIKITIANLKSKLSLLETNISTFKINEEYENLNISKENLNRDRKFLLNELTTIENQLLSIEKSLNITPDISLNKIFNLYESIKITFEKNIKKSLEEVSEFHNKLIETRQLRLKEEIKKLKLNKEIIKKQLNEINLKLDGYCEIFKNSGTFEEFEVLNNEYRELKIQLNDLEKYNKILLDTKNKQSELKIELDMSNIAAQNYLTEINTLIENIILTFNNFTINFYEGKESGISIKVNNNLNKQRFDIEAYIESDTSDGINEVKIFCFDSTLLSFTSNHNVRFLIHDSRLLSNMDARQQYSLFKTANDFFEENKLQYIIGINENMVDGMIKGTGEDWQHISELFEGDNNRIVLKLTDENEESKLLGKNISLKYES